MIIVVTPKISRLQHGSFLRTSSHQVIIRLQHGPFLRTSSHQVIIRLQHGPFLKDKSKVRGYF